LLLLIYFLAAPAAIVDEMSALPEGARLNFAFS